jgi:hypothetical protein
MSKDLKSRAEEYAHSYPFAKVSDAYIAGANEERKLLTEWHDASEDKPKVGGWYLIKITYTLDGEREERILTGCWNQCSQYWYDDHIDEYDGDDYEDLEITHWREIHENE